MEVKVISKEIAQEKDLGLQAAADLAEEETDAQDHHLVQAKNRMIQEENIEAAEEEVKIDMRKEDHLEAVVVVEVVSNQKAQVTGEVEEVAQMSQEKKVEKEEMNQNLLLVNTYQEQRLKNLKAL